MGRGLRSPRRCWRRSRTARAFEARSKLKTWVVGILKHKIVDSFRAHRREEPLADPDDDDLEDGIFQPDGHYRDWPTDWVTPESQLSAATSSSRRSRSACRNCRARKGGIFLMREWLELPTAEICKELAITTTNAGVLLHRARLRLRECLQLRWFETASS